MKTVTTCPPLQAGALRIVKLKTEGRLSTGDEVETLKLGVCTVVSIPTIQSLTVKNKNGKYFTLSGLFFPGAHLV